MNLEQEKETDFGGASESQKRRIIYFSNGETLEEDSSDEEDSAPHREPFTDTKDPAQLSWREYSWFLWMKFGKKSLRTCDFLGEKLANLVGLNAAKYQYAVDEYHRDKKEGLRHRGSDEAPVVEEGAERMQLSSQKNTDYGTTSSLRAAGPRASSLHTKHRTAGSHNKGYLEDEQ
ncbi:hypothetical protein MATL_G00202220 [Megalops atlanticus]|uniref:Protein FAM177A1 n=1 Tax=Megalops atlanticus TaxID=7932 RepID=A0A9D3PI97_MEGAT|nr:hypothetical protein MATL_G00202220 [Megalops atlanticus]